MADHSNDSSRGNVLIVDDTPANLQVLSGMLKDNGYKVRPAPSGKLALQGAEMLAMLCIEQASFDEAIHWTEKILQTDSCWEKAYQLQLICYGEAKNSVMLTRTYQRCLAVLDQELGVKPSPRTRELYERYNQKAEL